MASRREKSPPNELDIVLARLGLRLNAEETRELHEAFDRLAVLVARVRRENRGYDAEVLPVHVPDRDSGR